MDIKLTNRISTKAAANILNLGEHSVQGALIAGALPIGGAWKNEGASTFTYYISAQKLAEFCGISKEDVIRMANE